MSAPDRAAGDRPWHRPGAWRYARMRVRGLRRPPVTVTEPAPGTITIERDVAVPMRDGVELRANVYRPPGEGPFPVLLCAHPYGKDRLPKRNRRGYRVAFAYRVLRQPRPVEFSALTSWEAPDPVWWTAAGYAVVNADLRGAGTSGGTGSLMSDQEGEDVHDLIEWAAAQSWSTGAVGMLGVSYLAIAQWKAAALRPPSLAAICPWEGFTDAYRDLMRPGGIREDGFIKLWSRGIKRARLREQPMTEQRNRPLRDRWWQALVPDLERIEVPALICGSFSDNNLHSRGSFRAFERISSPHRYLFTHRGGKWATFYSDPAKAAQRAFFDRHLRGLDVPALPRVRLEVRESREQITQVRSESAWPLESTVWTPLYLGSEGLCAGPPAEASHATFDTGRDGVRLGWTAPSDTELTGPMALHVWVEVADADDAALFVGVEKWRGRRYVPFEGSYGFGRERVTTGWQRVSLRALDEQQSRPFEPVHTFTDPQPLQRGEIVPVDIALGPSATLFRAGEQLRLVVAGRWLWPRNPLTGGFPAAYEPSSRARVTLHWGPERPAHLLIPLIPRQAPLQ